MDYSVHQTFRLRPMNELSAFECACLPPTSVDAHQHLSGILPSSSVVWLSARPKRLELELGRHYIRTNPCSNVESPMASLLMQFTYTLDDEEEEGKKEEQQEDLVEDYVGIG
ncbi:hypothetical protein FQR65_LT11551 [Abscondita terminalis]|nr:hypothetical protein FQR65_LT11551 [Abscondita terminalis]